MNSASYPEYQPDRDRTSELFNTYPVSDHVGVYHYLDLKPDKTPYSLYHPKYKLIGLQ